MFLVGSVSSISSTFCETSSPNFSLVVTKIPLAFKSCSHCASTSAAIYVGFAVSSAIIKTSLGPATKSIPTVP